MTSYAAGRPQLVLEAGQVRLQVSPDRGGRISSLVVHGSELLVTEGAGPMLWGVYPMVPFAGRIRNGRFRFADRDIQLGLNRPPHAMHGSVFDRGWRVDDPTTISIDLGPAWPFAGCVVQRFSLLEDRLQVALSLFADEPMPAALGWHPWFRRTLAGSASRPTEPSRPVEIHLDAACMYLRDADGLPTGELVKPSMGPWDDCFTGLRSAPYLSWPNVLGLELRSSADHWVVYDGRADAICVEPQTAPPDFVNVAPSTTLPGEPLCATMTWRWWRLD